jgi:hypothetical protein
VSARALRGIESARVPRVVLWVQVFEAKRPDRIAIVRDALEHPGAAAVARVSPAVCVGVTPPGFDP